jgi:hypothetical protein
MWCDQEGFKPVGAAKFEELFAALCDLSGFARASGEVYCVGLQLAA